MTQLHDNEVKMSQLLVVSHLNGDDGDPQAIDNNQPPKSIIVEGFERRPTLAELLNPEIVVHKYNVTAGTACNGQAAMDDVKSRRHDVGDGAARNNPIPPENTMPGIGHKRESIQQNQTSPISHETFQIGDGLQGPQDDSKRDSARKFKKPKLKHISYTQSLLSLSPTPSPELIGADLGQKIEAKNSTQDSTQQDQTPPSPHVVVKEMEINNGLQVHPGDPIDGSAHKLKKPKTKRFNYTPPLPSLSPTPSPPKKNMKRPKVKWTKQEEKLLEQGLSEGLGWQAICSKYLPNRNRSGCFLHSSAMKNKLEPPLRDWTQEENEKLKEAIKNRSEDSKAIWEKIAQEVGNKRTWKEVEIQQAVLIVKEKDKKNT